MMGALCLLAQDSMGSMGVKHGRTPLKPGSMRVRHVGESLEPLDSFLNSLNSLPLLDQILKTATRLLSLISPFPNRILPLLCEFVNAPENAPGHTIIQELSTLEKHCKSLVAAEQQVSPEDVDVEILTFNSGKKKICFQINKRRKN